MRGILEITCVLAHVFGAYSFIIPDELPSILSVIYSNIPTIKKGTDSRLGWGFRLGDRADFQVLVELGPQTNTQPLGNQQDTSSSSRKRNTVNNFANALYAQQQDAKNQISNTDGGRWLQEWRKSLNKPRQPVQKQEEPKLNLGIGEIDAKSVIPDDSILKLRELLKVRLAATTSTTKSTNEDTGVTTVAPTQVETIENTTVQSLVLN